MGTKGGGGTRGGGAGGHEAAKEQEAEVEHAAGGAQSAMAPPWFCDKLGARDRCRGHLLFYPNVIML